VLRWLEKTLFYPYQVFFASERKENQGMMQKYVKGLVGDLGCGSANYRPFCLSLPGVTDYLGMDYPVWAENFNHSVALADSMGALGQTLLRAAPSGAQLWVDGTRLAIGDNRFDTLLSLGVLEHIPNHRAYLSEVCRVLKPGGCLVITIPFLYQAHGGAEGADDFYRWTRSGLVHELKLAGLECLEVEPFGGVGAMFSQLVNGYLIKKIKVYRPGNPLRPLLLGASLTPLFFLVNCIAWVLERLDRDSTFASGYRAVGRKPFAPPGQ